jgi:hypothetical protein
MRLLFVLVFLSSFSLSAQKQTYGVKFGGNTNNIVGDNTKFVSSTIGFHGGFFTEMFVAEKTAFQAEFLFASYGYEIENVENNSDVRLNYLVLSVFPKIYISKTISLDAGPQVGLLISAKEGKGMNVGRSFYNRDFGVNIGASYNISNKLVASIRYYVGLTDVTIVNINNYNRAFQLALQFKIN